MLRVLSKRSTFTIVRSLRNKSLISAFDSKRTREFELVQSIKDCGINLKKAYSILQSAKSENNSISQEDNELGHQEAKFSGPTILRGYNAILHACSDLGDVDTVLKLFKEIKEDSTSESSSIKPDSTTYRRAIFTCAKAENWELSLKFLREMETNLIIPDVRCYGAVISACGSGDQWEKALEVFNTMLTYGVKPNVISFTSAIRVCERCKRYEEALELFRLMKKYNVKPNVVTFATVISACGNSGQWQLALSIFNSMQYHNVVPNIVVFNATISACGKAGQWQKALEVFKSMDDASPKVKRDGFTFSAAISACERGKQWERALKLLDYMEYKNIQPNEFNFCVCIAACSKAGQIEKAIQLFESMEKRGCKPGVITYSALINACEKSGKWEHALDLFDDMKVRGVSPNSFTLAAVINAYDKGGLWEKVVDMVDSLQMTKDTSKERGGNKVKPTEYIINAAIGACSKAGQWETALKMFDSMETKYKLKPTLASYNNAMFACAVSGQWERALLYLNQMQVKHKIKPDTRSYSAVISVCQKGGQLDKAIELLNEMDLAGLKPTKVNFSSIIQGHVEDSIDKEEVDDDARSAFKAKHTCSMEEDERLPEPNMNNRKTTPFSNTKITKDALKTLRMALDRGVFAHVWKPKQKLSYKKDDRGIDTIDLHDCSAPVALTVVQYFLNHYRERQTFPVVEIGSTEEDRDNNNLEEEDVENELKFQIVTGKGNHTPGGQKHAVLGKLVRSFLKEQEGIPIHEHLNNSGAFFVKAQDILKQETYEK